MNRTSLLALLVTLVLGAVVIADPKVALRNGTGEDTPNPMSKINHDEPLFLRGRNGVLRENGRVVPDGEADLRVLDTFDARFMNLRDH